MIYPIRDSPIKFVRVWYGGFDWYDLKPGAERLRVAHGKGESTVRVYAVTGDNGGPAYLRDRVPLRAVDGVRIHYRDGRTTTITAKNGVLET